MKEKFKMVMEAQIMLDRKLDDHTDTKYRRNSEFG
jgi:hypothetical protein